jgi:putative peptidoglycan lipid II flippase
MVVLASPVVSLLFERGAFGPADTQATARVMQAYAIGLLPYGMVKVLAPVFYSVNRPRIPLAASISGVTVNLVFNAWTYRTLGAPGLALGTSLGAFANVAVLRWFLRTEVGALGPTGARVGEVLRVAVASFAMAGTAVLMWRVFAPWVRVDDTLARLWSLGLALAVTLATSGGVYFVVLVVLRDPRVSTLRRRLGRGVS